MVGRRGESRYFDGVLWIPLLGKCIRFLVFGLLVFGFLVSKFIGFKVAWFIAFKVSRLQVCKDFHVSFHFQEAIDPMSNIFKNFLNGPSGLFGASHFQKENIECSTFEIYKTYF